MSSLLRPSDLARFWGLHPVTIAQWIRAGRLESVRTPGGQRRIRDEAVRELCAREGRPVPPSARERADAPVILAAGLGASFARALKSSGDALAIASHPRVLDAVVAAVKEAPALFAIDARAEDADAADAIRVVRRERPLLPILAIDSPSAKRTAELTRSGATRVLSRSRPRGALADAIHELLTSR